MNQSGPKLVKKFQKWLEVRDKKLGLVGCRKGMTPETWPGLPATLVILHDELEERLGSVRVKRGGPEEASLQGHRGLLSVFESLRGRGVYPFDETKCRIKEGVPPRDLSVLRVGFGIGRPESREKDDVADYVLTDMSPRELEAVERAAKFVFHTLNREFFWNIPEADRPASSGASKVVDSAATSDAPKVVDSAATSGASNVVDSAASSHAPKVVDGATSSGASNV